MRYIIKNQKKRDIYDVIRTAKYNPDKIGKYKNSLIIGRESIWNSLGDKILSIEKRLYDNIPYDSYYTVRMDGINFSSSLKRLKKDGLLENGYSHIFERVMIKVAESLLNKTEGAILIFTQSDEITILVRKCDKKIDGSYKIPEKSRRYIKYLSSFSGKATALFNLFLCEELKTYIKCHILCFDARIGVHNNFKDAFEVLLWRSYDCSVNGVSSGIIMNNLKKFFNLNTTDKLKKLEELGILDKMTDHQLYGTTIIKDKSNIFINENLANCIKEDKYFNDFM